MFRAELGDDFRGNDSVFRDRRALFHIHKLLSYRKRTLADFGLDIFICAEEIAEMEAHRPPIQLEAADITADTREVIV